MAVAINLPDTLQFVIGRDPRTGDFITEERNTADVPENAWPHMIQKSISRCITDIGGDKDLSHSMTMEKRREFIDFNVMVGMPGWGRGRPSDPVLKQMRIDAEDYGMPKKAAKTASHYAIKEHYESVGLNYEEECQRVVDSINRKRELVKRLAEKEAEKDA
jgi:hypothetical protein